MKARSWTVDDARAIVDRLGERLGRAQPVAIRLRPAHSNNIAEVEFDTGRTLVIKQARYADMQARLESSRVAARLLRKQTRVRVPEYLELPDERGILVYWRVPLPTLEQCWTGLRGETLRHTLRSWGELIGHIQQVRLPGHGDLLDVEQRPRSLVEFLRGDLQQRLRPAVVGVWPAALSIIDELTASAKRIQARVGDAPAVLVHNDLFASNILCEQTATGVLACVGVIDFEDAFAGPPEAELAKLEILHGPLFGQPRGEGFLLDILAGYGGRLDAQVLAYFRVFHLLNMGFHAALTGLESHAADVLAACRRELEGGA